MSSTYFTTTDDNHIDCCRMKRIISAYTLSKPYWWRDSVKVKVHFRGRPSTFSLVIRLFWVNFLLYLL